MNNVIKKQWEQDVADYGDNAYLMWMVKCCGIFTPCDYLPIGEVLTTEWQRKQSADLPFDLERANNGDAVEFFADEWVDCHLNFFKDGMIGVTFNGGVGSASPQYLRMKYPLKKASK